MDDVRKTLDELNLAWRERRFDKLAEFFDAGVVMKGPAFQELGRGRDQLVGSYADFMGKSEVVEYEESNWSTERWGDTAVATFDWRMVWEQGGKRDQGSGHDLFVFRREGGRWLAVLRVMVW